MMQEPLPQDYGLTPSEVVAAQRQLGLFGGVIGGFGALAFGVAGATSIPCLGVVAAFPGWGLGRRAGAWLARSLNPQVAPYSQFRDAIEAYEQWRKQEEERLRRLQSEFWTTLSGHRFEDELGKLFEQDGYQVTKTPGSGDGGVDLILNRDGRKIVVQCKQTKNPVGPAIARELHSVLVTFEAHEGILAATGGVTSGVDEFFRGKPLRVMRLQDILEMQRRLTEPVGAKAASGRRS